MRNPQTLPHTLMQNQRMPRPLHLKPVVLRIREQLPRLPQQPTTPRSRINRTTSRPTKRLIMLSRQNQHFPPVRRRRHDVDIRRNKLPNRDNIFPLKVEIRDPLLEIHILVAAEERFRSRFFFGGGEVSLRQGPEFLGIDHGCWGGVLGVYAWEGGEYGFGETGEDEFGEIVRILLGDLIADDRAVGVADEVEGFVRLWEWAMARLDLLDEVVIEFDSVLCIPLAARCSSSIKEKGGSSHS